MTVDEAIERLTEFKRVYGGDCQAVVGYSCCGAISEIQEIRDKKNRKFNNQCVIVIGVPDAND